MGHPSQNNDSLREKLFRMFLGNSIKSENV
jgi:hypothetical protein